MLRRLALRTVIAASLVTTACGGDAERMVEDRVYDLYDVFAARDAQRACEALTTRARDEVVRQAGARRKERTCERTLSAALEASDEGVTRTSEIRVTDVTVDGDTAEASVVLRGVRSRLGLARRDGEWKVDRLPGGAG